jgi:hypothetical protein
MEAQEMKFIRTVVGAQKLPLEIVNTQQLGETNTVKDTVK